MCKSYDNTFLQNIYLLFLLERSQARTNNKQSEPDANISGVPQGSIFGPIFYNIFSMIFYYFKGFRS